MDPDSGSSVTLIYYRIGEKWWKEPFLNVVAAAAQMSTLTHVEIALGEEVGTNGMMTNVCRVFNDAVRSVCPCAFQFTQTLPSAAYGFGACTGRRRARRAHRPQPALRLPEPRLLQGVRQPHAALRQDAVRGQAVFKHGHGALVAVAAADGRNFLFLRRHALLPPTRVSSTSSSARAHRCPSCMVAQNSSPPS